jgi:hypothetical protein
MSSCCMLVAYTTMITTPHRRMGRHTFHMSRLLRSSWRLPTWHTHRQKHGHKVSVQSSSLMSRAGS